MHFDTEEGILYRECAVVHPVVSSVLYLSGTAAAGPTVVLDQRYGDAQPARSAHVSHPKENHVLFFPGDRLHGVCPAAPPPADAARRAPRAGRAPPLHSAATLPRRVTLMIGFWTRDVYAAVPRAPYSACGPTPRASRHCTWPSLLALDAAGPEDAEPPPPPKRHGVPQVSPAWEALPPRDAADAWAKAGRPPLTVPDERNNHFFVRGMDEDFVFEHIGEAAK